MVNGAPRNSVHPSTLSKCRQTSSPSVRVVGGMWCNSAAERMCVPPRDG
jgi:hypothetical protein